ncbi:DUF2637 domain-containing protein [Streptomyces marispadix]|uniref:DUF2637 domain-containing protein n=1 Tax=Streptomyces marispadix TaxID=2922868 RepID=UPI003FD8928E
MVVIGAVTIAAIGFAGSFAAVRDLAARKGFGAFAPFFPIGIDAGIVVLLALDLLLTWIRIPFPLLRQTAWLLTAATIAFNGAAAWPDALGVGMHAVIPVLFVVSVEAARHAIGRIADITADKHMEGVRVSRWLLAFPSTFKLWRRMKLWELRSYDEVIRMEQERLVYEARLQAHYGRGWRRKAPVESLMPLKLARYGVPLAETGPSGLAAAGIEAPATLTRARTGTATGAAPGAADGQGTELSPASASGGRQRAALTAGEENGTVDLGGGRDEQQPQYRQLGTAASSGNAGGAGDSGAPTDDAYHRQQHNGHRRFEQQAQPQAHYEQQLYDQSYDQQTQPYEGAAPAMPEDRPPAEPRRRDRAQSQTQARSQPQSQAQGRVPDAEGTAQDGQAPEYTYAAETTASGPQVTVPVGPGRRRALGNSNAPGSGSGPAYLPPQRAHEQQLFMEPEPAPRALPDDDAPPVPSASDEAEPVGIPDGVPREEFYFSAYREFAASNADFPNARQLSRALHERHGVTNADGSLLSEAYLRTYMREFKERYNTEMGLAG